MPTVTAEVVSDTTEPAAQETSLAVPERLSVAEEIETVKADLLAVITDKWKKTADVLPMLPTREDIPVQAYRIAYWSLVNTGQIESNDFEAGRYCRLKPAPKPQDTDAGLGNPLSDRECMERYLRKVEMRLGQVIPRTYRRGRESAWEDDQRAQGRRHDLDDIPPEQWEQWRTAAKSYLVSHGKGRSPLAIDLQAAKMHRMETAARVERAVNVTPQPEAEGLAA